ncbi:hypothetical protein Kisp01_68610 [Kineosporia sp. NBRC 101677]|nr:hypothetical protein Kisp01_68610 [Kineosporia sp. NBRC 101677]
MITQVTVVVEVFRSAWMVGSTGVTSDCRSEMEAVALASTAKMTSGETRRSVDRDMSDPSYATEKDVQELPLGLDRLR